MKIVVLAGGVGTRLWPLSRANSPKQIKPFFGKYTLLQKTINRLRKKFSASDIFIITGQNFSQNIRAQLPSFPKSNILIEPARRNTAAAIGLAVYTIAKKSPKETIVCIASDHFIEPDEKFLKSLRKMDEVVTKNPQAVCLMGIEPTYPETGYGYIERGEKVRSRAHAHIYAIKSFREKPALGVAKRFVASGKYLWNPSYFAWRADRVIELFAKFQPQMHKLLLATVAGRTNAFKKIQAPSIDYAIIEKLKKDFYVIKADFDWADVGHWASVREIQSKNIKGNVTLGLQHHYNTEGSLIYNYTDSLLTTVGVKDLIIVQTEDGTLVCHRDRAQDVKKLVEQMHQEKKLRKFL